MTAGDATGSRSRPLAPSRPALWVAAAPDDADASVEARCELDGHVQTGLARANSPRRGGFNSFFFDSYVMCFFVVFFFVVSSKKLELSDL